MRKPKLLLLDSDVVVVCHELGIWEQLKAKYSVHVSSIVIEEAIYYEVNGRPVGIDLNAQCSASQISAVEATASQMASVTGNFVDSFAQGLDDGEIEGIAIMIHHDLEDCAYCTGDTNAMQAIGMLAPTMPSVSLEEILEMCGLRSSITGKLPLHLTKRNHEIQITEGNGRRLSGLYFRTPPL